MRNFINHFFILQRAGSSLLLLIADLILLAFLIYDTIDLHSFIGTSILSVNGLLDAIENLSLKGIGVSFVYLMILPLAVAVASFAFPKFHAHKHTSYAVRNYFFVFHVIVSLLLCLAVSNMDNFNQLAGYSLIIDSKGDAVLSDNYRSVIVYLTLYLPLVLTGGFYIYKLIESKAKNRTDENQIDFSKSWELFLGLADATAEYMPSQDFRKWIVYFNNASMSPDIKWILKKSIEYRAEYQKKIPTSDEARSYLKKIAKECKEILLDHMIDDKYSVSHNVEFYPGTSRAFEVILSKSPNIKHVVVSPMEHDSQVDVIKWFEKNHSSLTHEIISFKEEYIRFDLQKKIREELLIGILKQKIQNKIKDIPATNIAILLSEVNYKTGYTVDIATVVKKLKKEFSGLVFIIDGSQSVGNIEKPYKSFSDSGILGRNDFYYFSAHKWLLSPSTCGVVISKRLHDPDQRSYDVFDFDLPTSTIDPNTIFGLRASIEFIYSEMTFREMRKRSKLLRGYFEKTMTPGFEPIGEIERFESCFIAIRPKPHYKWIPQSKDAILEHFKTRSLDATVLAIDVEDEKQEHWIRLSFPYFIEQFQIDRLNKILAQCVEKVIT